jgi:UDP-N-acetylglucosamine--N-acetylmuramyl-(pentapeptide) pyrophosphoryl-undecaprenol N-acetylglucosamine transferase
MKNKNRLMIMAGGTGGHVFPALAVAESLRAKGSEVAWLGTRAGLEARVVPERGFEMHWVDIKGVRGSGLLGWCKAPFRILSAVWQSFRAVRAFRPGCVLGMGGFVAGPGGVAAKLTGTPLIVHEQNAVAGLTNRVLAKIASRVLSGFPNVNGLPTAAEWVGNPVRNDIYTSNAEEQVAASVAVAKLKVLVIGGSQGAHSFNVYLPQLLQATELDLDIWHQSGRGRLADTEDAYAATDLKPKLSEFIDDMAAALAWADVLVCRAGAMTLAECCAAGKPALLVPYPFSAGDHQRVNGQMMVDAGAAVMVDNAALQDIKTATVLTKLFADRNQLLAMGRSARELARPDALDRVVAVCEELMHA